MHSIELAGLLAFATSVSAHGFLNYAFIGGVRYFVGSPNWMYPGQNPGSQPGWYAYNQDDGFVSPSAYQTPDIICHKNATPGNSFLTVAAGSTIGLQWNTWPDGHHGDVMNYLAPVSGDFSTIDKTALTFYAAEVDGWHSGSNPGLWATDTLIANNFTGEFTIPAKIPAGNYVLRHEIISLHAANNAGGAQNYPMCVNLKITGGGSTDPIAGGADARVGEKLYKADDPGINFNIYQAFTTYQIPGPAVWTGLSGSGGAAPTSAAPTTVASSTPTTMVTSTKPTTTAAPTTAKPTTSSKASTTSTRSVPSSSSQCTITITRSKTSSSAASTPTAACAAKYAQCGGQGWTGATCCASGSTCKASGQYYSQCL